MNHSTTQINLIEQFAKAKSSLQIFLALSLDLFCICGQNGYLKPLNSAWEKVLGWTSSELLRTPWIEFVHPDDVEVTRNAAKQCRQEYIAEYENRCRHKDGSYRWLYWRVLQDEDGLSYAVAKDITAIKQAEEAFCDCAARTLGERTEKTPHDCAPCTLRYRLDLERLITTLSTQFINLSLEEIDSGINHALQVIGKFTGFDRSNIRLFCDREAGVYTTPPEGSVAKLAYQWSAEPIEPLSREVEQVSTTSFPWLMEQLRRFEAVQISSRTDLPAEADSTRRTMQFTGAQSIIVVPIAQDKSLIGFIEFAALTEEKTCSDDIVALLKIVGDIFANALNRKQVEEALRESEERWQLVLRGNNDSIWDFNFKTNQCFHSPRWREILGYEEHEFSNDWDDWETRVHSDDIGRVMQVRQDHLEGKIPYYSAEYRVRGKDGSYKWILSRSQALWDKAGNPVRMVGSHTDITERKQWEEALKASEARFRCLCACSPVGIFLADAEGHCMYANPRLLTITGLTFEEILGEGWVQSVHPSDREWVFAQWSECTQRGQECLQEYRFQTPEGTVRWVQTRKSPMRCDQSQPIGYVGTIEDITERKHVEAALQQLLSKLETTVEERTVNLKQVFEALKKSEARYRAIVEDQTELICRYQPDGTLTFVNNAYCRYFSKQHSELLGHSFSPEVPEEEQESVKERLRSLSHAQPIVTGEHRVILPSREIRWLQWTDRMMFDEEGKWIEIQAVGRDITTLKQAEAEILKALEKERELSELRSGFVSLVSHEFRTPLTTIQSSSELLERYSHKLSEEKKQNHFKRIQTAVFRMTQLLEDILTIGTAEAGKLKFEPTQTDLVALCREIIESIQVSLYPSHTINFIPLGDGSNVRIDEKLLGHIITNLLSNAIKYSPQGGTVQFDLVCNNSRAIFRIQDKGIGIPREDLENLFESFRRASNVGTIPGTGLGLAIVKRCVELHGGKIAIESEVTEGTTFTVTLPLG